MKSPHPFLGDVLTVLHARPGAVGLVLTLLTLLMLVHRLRRRWPVPTDPRRLFTAAERTQGFARAGRRCEHKHPLWFRCPAPATHGDHVHPWSRGGATRPGNLQALCEAHNLRKGATVPSRLYRWRLHRRRRRYFPPGTPTAVAWRLHSTDTPRAAAPRTRT